MAFEKNFCPSPWFHMRINNSGTYEYCRWRAGTGGTRVDFSHNIRHQTPTEYFQQELAPLRQALLNGEAPPGCSGCYIMEQHNKVSGRQRQLLKVGIQEQYFEKSLSSTTLKSAFDYSNNNQGLTDRTVTDWQIDLGNYCNGACVYCGPESSSRLATEFQKLGLIDQIPPPAWCDDPELVDQFVQVLASSPALQYLHFIGGETLITPGFKTILSALVDAGVAKDITVGFTTNLTVWSDDIVDLLKQFCQVHLGMSVETLTPINDYVRYPSRRAQTQELLDRWVNLGQQHDWLIQLRITPTCLTVHELHTVYDYAWQNNIAVESCNFIDNPKFMRISVLPQAHRLVAIQTLKAWVQDHQTTSDQQIINTRDPHIAQTQIVQDAQSYLNYLTSVEDESHRLPDLIKFLKTLESNRGNSILTYLPQYEELFRSAGY